MKFTLNGFAQSKTIVLNKLGQHMEPYIEHMLKIYLWPNSQYRDHWIKEIYSFFKTVNKIKSNNKFPEASDIYASIYGGAEDCIYDRIDNYVVDVCDAERDLLKKDLTDEDKKQFMNFIHNYSIWLASKLSTNGYVSHEEVKNKICELM